MTIIKYVDGVPVPEKEDADARPAVPATLVVNTMPLEVLPTSPARLVFGGSPPKLLAVDDTAGLQAAVAPESLVNHYVTALELPSAAHHGCTTSVTVRNLQATDVAGLLQQHAGTFRRLMLSAAAPPEYTTNTGCQIAHALRAGHDFGFTIGGFPARVTTVSLLQTEQPHYQSTPSSQPFKKQQQSAAANASLVHPGQAVVAVVIPGRPPLTPADGGFTGERVTQVLAQHAHVPNRIVILQQAMAVDYTTKFDPACGAPVDDCCVVL